MSKVTLAISSFFVLLFIVLMTGTILIAPKSWSLPSADKISVQVRAPSDVEVKTLGPTMLVLLTNNTNRTVYIDRHLSGVPISGHNSLIVDVTNAKSGKSADLRAAFKPIKRTWNADDFMALAPQYSYGPVIRLRDYFRLEPGKTYRVRFEYRSFSPKKVGSMHPWSGIAKSKTIYIKVSASDE
jgi:hypothetical protein